MTSSLNVCAIRKSFRQVQDTKVGHLSSTFHYGGKFYCLSRGRKVTSVGILFDFTGNDHNTTVQEVEDMVKEAWVSHVPSSFLLSRARAYAASLPMQSRKSPTCFSSLGMSISFLVAS